MQVRLVDPQSLKVLRTYPDMTSAIADPAATANAIWCESDSDEAAAIQATERIRTAQEAQQRHQARQRAQAVSAAGVECWTRAVSLLMRARESIKARRTILEWSVRNASSDNSRASDDQKLREVNALLADIDELLGL